MTTEFMLVQQAQANGFEIVNEDIIKCTYIESGDIGGVKLLMTLNDPTSDYHDIVKIQKGTEIKITFGDPNGRGDESWTCTFIVEVAKADAELLTIEGFDSVSRSLKELASEPMFFIEMQPNAILKKLCPSLQIKCDSFPKGSTYHLNAGGTRARLIRQMARDYGAMCFISRGVIYFLSISKLPEEPQMTLEQDNPNAEASIAKFEKIGEDALYERILDRNYMAWDTVEGMQSSNKGKSNANTLISVPSRFALDNQNVALIPLLNAELYGNGKFKPAMCVKVIFYKRTTESVIDESVPSIQFVSQVVHHQEGTNYLCKLELSVKHE
ncbi:hypothetical protein I6Y99_004335 [Vibrio parahaemolyticus]|nr:hypothetical protein [Vibrio parahaemolyticus]